MLHIFKQMLASLLPVYSSIMVRKKSCALQGKICAVGSPESE